MTIAAPPEKLDEFRRLSRQSESPPATSSSVMRPAVEAVIVRGAGNPVDDVVDEIATLLIQHGWTPDLAGIRTSVIQRRE